MKLMSINQFQQSYSQYQDPKPQKVWAFCVGDGSGFDAAGFQGIKAEVLDRMVNHAEKWTGWGFLDGQAWLLFDLKSDAMYAKIMLGNGK